MPFSDHCGFPPILLSRRPCCDCRDCSAGAETDCCRLCPCVCRRPCCHPPLPPNPPPFPPPPEESCPVPDAPAITYPAAGQIVSANRITVTGTAVPGTVTEVCVDGLCGAALADETGAWSYAAPNELLPGDHTVTAAATNDCGSVSAAVTVGFTTADVAAELEITDLRMGQVYRTVGATFRTVNEYRGMTVYYVLLSPGSPAPTADEIIAYADETALVSGAAARGKFYVPPETLRTSVTKNLRGREVDAPLAQETGVVDGYPYTVYAVGVLDTTGTRTNVATYAGSAIGMPFESGAGTARDPFVIRDYSPGELAAYPDQLSGHPINRTGADETARQLDNIQGMADMNLADPAKGLAGTLAADYLLQSDVNLSSYESAYGNQGWRPIGTAERNSAFRFTGTFDGGGHTIGNLPLTPNYAVQPVRYSGLFGLADNATIKNLRLDGVRSAPVPESGQISAGALAGALKNTDLTSISVSGATFSFTMPASDTTNVFAGGIAGELNGGTHTDIAAEDVSFDDTNGATDYSGGQFGYVSNNDSPLAFSRVSLNNIGHGVYGGTPGLVFGGMIGLLNLVNAANALTLGVVTADNITAAVDNMDAGGLIGRFFQYASASIANITASGVSLSASVSGFHYVGGVFGDCYSHAKLDINAVAVSSANVKAYSGAGGVFGELMIYENSYAELHNLTADAAVTAINSYAGGLIGELYREGASYVRLFDSGVSGGSRIDSPNQAGGLVGDLFHTTTASYVFIDNCVSAAEVDGESVGRYAGGLVGFGNYVAVKGCTATGKILGSREEFSVGGLFGEASGIYMTDCHYAGDITGYTYVGGLIGTAHGVTIGADAYPAPFPTQNNVVELCSARGSISVAATGQAIGGLAGEAKDLLFDRSFAKMTIADMGSVNVGGLVGVRDRNEFNNRILATDCYFSGAITGAGNFVGGAGGSSTAPTERAFAYGSVAGETNVAGILGNQTDSDARVAACFALESAVSAAGANAGRIANPAGGNYADNYALTSMTLTENGAARTPVVDANGRDGGNVDPASLAAAMQANGYSSAVWDFSSVASLGYPTLVGNPE